MENYVYLRMIRLWNLKETQVYRDGKKVTFSKVSYVHLNILSTELSHTLNLRELFQIIYCAFLLSSITLRYNSVWAGGISIDKNFGLP